MFALLLILYKLYYVTATSKVSYQLRFCRISLDVRINSEGSHKAESRVEIIDMLNFNPRTVEKTHALR